MLAGHVKKHTATKYREDQRLALDWVQKHIRAFGPGPSNHWHAGRNTLHPFLASALATYLLDRAGGDPARVTAGSSAKYRIVPESFVRPCHFAWRLWAGRLALHPFQFT